MVRRGAHDRPRDVGLAAFFAARGIGTVLCTDSLRVGGTEKRRAAAESGLGPV